jgi:hypothetical protein
MLHAHDKPRQANRLGRDRGARIYEKNLTVDYMLLFIGLLLWVGAASAGTTQIHIAIGQASMPLNGPWKFHTGDNLRWSDPDFDDSTWENVNLTAPPGARDNDVGLPGYVSGWGARGHAGYYGYAWYRLHLSVSLPAGETLALAGPFAVDSAYQLYANGRLLGGVGDFSGSTPTAYSHHRPALFTLPPEMTGGGDIVLAVRVWRGSFARAPDAGGIHIAPIIGASKAVTDQYRLQWLLLFEGYVVDAIEGLIFVLLALMALSIMPFDRSDWAYVWLAAALLLIAIHRGNQAIMFLGHFETIHDFEFFIIVLAIPLYMGTWIIAWREWFKLRNLIWLPRVVAGLTLTYVLAAFLGRSWFRGVFPEIMFTSLHYVINTVRYALLFLYLLVTYQGVRHTGREGWYTLPAVLVLGVGLYGQEIFYLGTPGIWFPFGIGLSLSECAYAVFEPLLAGLLLRRLWSCAQASHLALEEPA